MIDNRGVLIAKIIPKMAEVCYNIGVKKILARYNYSLILLRELVKTDFKLRYQGSILGMLWSVLKPLMLFAVMYVVFVRFLKFGAGIPHFPVMLFLGIVFWQFFSEATSQGMTSIVGRGDILRKINIPKFVVVISTTFSALINFGINLMVVFVFALINGVDITWMALLIVPLIIELFVFSLAVSFILSALYVKFRDLSHIWEVVMQAGYFLTPIIYPLSMVIAMSPLAAKILLLSPMAQMIQDARWAVVSPSVETVWNQFNFVPYMLIPFIITVAFVAVSALYFRRASKRFTELV
jgi:ABC-2 type transport system permease protein